MGEKPGNRLTSSDIAIFCDFAENSQQIVLWNGINHIVFCRTL